MPPLNSCGIIDAHGCCTSAGYFWCGASRRCTFGDDVCEDGTRSDTSYCGYYDKHLGVSYDLSPLSLQTERKDYVISDTESSGLTRNYTFIFNVCANAVTPAACVQTMGGAGDTLEGPAPAFQMYEEWATVESIYSNQNVEDLDTSCFRLGASISNKSDVRVGLYDDTQPARGVYIRYLHGNTCDADTADTSAVGSTNTSLPNFVGTGSSVETNRRFCNAVSTTRGEHCTRSLQLNVLCDNTEHEVPEATAIEQLHPCAYRITIKSIHGCPLQCARDPKTLAVCSDHGVCGYVGNRAKCLCERGWFGDDCAFRSAAAAESSKGRDIRDITLYDMTGTTVIWWLFASAFLLGIIISFRWRHNILRFCFATSRCGSIADSSEWVTGKRLGVRAQIDAVVQGDEVGLLEHSETDFPVTTGTTTNEPRNEKSFHFHW